jgi:hypothetical protein
MAIRAVVFDIGGVLEITPAPAESQQRAPYRCPC